jgi:hypothetical protein
MPFFFYSLFAHIAAPEHKGFQKCLATPVKAWTPFNLISGFITR